MESLNQNWIRMKLRLLYVQHSKLRKIHQPHNVSYTRQPHPSATCQPHVSHPPEPASSRLRAANGRDPSFQKIKFPSAIFEPPDQQLFEGHSFLHNHNTTWHTHLEADRAAGIGADAADSGADAAETEEVGEGSRVVVAEVSRFLHPMASRLRL